MNKLTKVGCSALCGSLAAIASANAGELTVTGGIDMTWMSLEDDTTGNPIGMGSNLTFKGSGELDNGWTFDLTIAELNAGAYSSTAVNLVMGGLGSLNFNQGDSGNGIDALDDKMPTAWEEPWGAGVGTGIQLVSGSGNNNNVQYTTPKILGVTIAAATSFDVGGSDPNDKGASGDGGGTTGQGYDATININPSLGTEILSGLNLFVGGHITETHPSGEGDRYEGVGGITFDLGPISVGYAKSGITTGLEDTGTNVSYYKNTMYGVAFNVNDNLSVSYGFHDSQQGFVNPGDNESVMAEVESFQIAYTMGGASIRLAEIDADNTKYQTGASFDKEATVMSVSLAF